MYLCLQEDNEKHLMDCISHNLNIDMIFPRDWKGENEILSHRPSLLGMAAFYCAIKCFRLLIANGATITTKDEASTSIASFAAAGGSIDILTILNEFDVDFSNSLRYAAMYGKTEAFFWIYNNRFNQRELFQTIQGKTILHFAAKGGSGQIMRFLLDETNINVNSKSELCVIAIVL